MNLVRGIDLRKIADKMTGASGAELKVCPILLPLEYGNLSFTISVQDCGAEPVQECVHSWEEHSKTSAFSHGWGRWCMGYAPAKRGCKASHACSRQSQDLLTAGQKGTTTQIKSSWQCARTRQCARTKYSDSCICFAGMLHRGWHVCAQGKKGTCHSGKASCSICLSPAACAAGFINQVASYECDLPLCTIIQHGAQTLQQKTS